MRTKKIYLYIIPTLLLVAFITLTLLVAYYDRDIFSSFVPGGETGLQKFNNLFPHFSYNETLDKISDIFMIIGLLMMFIAFGVGLYQLIKRKGLKKVDFDIYLFGGEIVIMIIVWLLFEIFPISYRPLTILDLESSFPSTHVMIVATTYLSFSWMISKRYPKLWIKIVAYAFSTISIAITFAFRLVSGMHWFTDCLGGLLISLAMVSIFMISDSMKKQKIRL